MAHTPRTPQEAHRLAYAISRDAGNRSMKAAGRCVWTRADASAAAEACGQAYATFGLLNANAWLPEGYEWRKVEGEWMPVAA